MKDLYDLMLNLIHVSNKIYERKEYISKIEKYLDTNLIKVLVGERRVGKSYIMKTFIQKLNTNFSNNILYLNFEIDDFSGLKKNEKLKDFFDNYFLKNIDKNKKIYVFLDEVQEVENWQIFVNSLLAKYNEKIDIFISGSNSKLLSGELSTYLSGRYIEFLVLPFNFFEYTEYTGKYDILDYLKSSGLPEALKLSKLEDRELLVNYFRSLKDTLLLKDVIERHKIKDSYLLERLFLFLVDNISNFSSVNNIVKKLRQEGIKTNHVTLGSYIVFLEQTFLIYSLQKYDIKGKKFFENEKKYYLNDLGFKNFLTSNYDLGLSKSLENYVFLILKRKGYEIYIGDLKNGEIDFIGEKGGKKIFVQVSIDIQNEIVFKRELAPFFEIQEKQSFYLVTIGKQYTGNYKGINILDIETFEKSI